MFKKILVIVSIILAIYSFAGCGESTGFLGGDIEEEKDMVTSSEIYIPIDKIRTLNPVITKDEDAYYIDKLIYEGLFGLDENLALVNVLADSFSYGEWGYSVNIKIKENIKWHDGQAFTAEDVKFSIESYIYAVNSGSSMYSSYVNNIKQVKLDKDNPNIVQVFFINNNNISMENFIFPIIPKHQFNGVASVKLLSQGFIPIGTGPYKLVEYNELTHIILKGNETYHTGNIPKNTMNFQIMPNKLDAINLMDMNNISLIISKGIDRDTIYTNKNVNVVPFASNEVEFVGFNFRSNIMKNKKVRKAIAYSIDVEEIVNAGYFKNGILNDTIYYPNYLGIESSEIQYKFDVTNSQKLLTEAGYIDRDGDGIVENSNNEKLIINILVNSEDQQRIAAAHIIKNGLDKLPIQSYIIYKDWSAYNTDLSLGEFDIFIGGFQIKENYDLRNMLHTDYLNVIGYSNPTLDILLDKMESGLSNTDKVNTFSKIKDILNEDLPYFCLLYKTYGAIASPALQGDIEPYFNNLYHGCEKWTCVYEKAKVVEE